MKIIKIICDWCGKHFEREDKKEKEPDFYFCSEECVEKNNESEDWDMHT